MLMLLRHCPVWAGLAFAAISFAGLVGVSCRLTRLKGIQLSMVQT
jgi:hypothetical protein